VSEMVAVLYPIIESTFKVCPSPISWKGRDFWKALETGNWEYENIKYITENVKQGDIVLDVGAWIGPYTLLFSALKAITCAFEPDPDARHLLRVLIQVVQVVAVLMRINHRTMIYYIL